jgi:hypothetical protein
MKVLVGNQVGLNLALKRAPGGFDRISGKRALMSCIKPDSPVKWSEGDVR